LVDVTSAILEDKPFEYSNKVYFGNKIEFDHDANNGTVKREADTETVVNGDLTGSCSGLNDDVVAVYSPHSQASTSSHCTLPLESVPPGQEIDVVNPHTRSFQACNECRRRHIKCDLGPVDNPRAPPCARCRRENHKCTFATQRRKRKAGEEEATNGNTKRKCVTNQQPASIGQAVTISEEDTDGVEGGSGDLYDRVDFDFVSLAKNGIWPEPYELGLGEFEAVYVPSSENYADKFFFWLEGGGQ
jgi:hypothetical protein